MASVGLVGHVRAGEGPTAGCLVHDLSELAIGTVTSLLTREVETTSELPIGHVELLPGQEVYEHIHNRSEAIFLLKGRLVVTRGGGSAELSPHAAAYFPAETPHSLRVLGDEPVSFLVTYAMGEHPSDGLSSRALTDGDLATDWGNPNIISGGQPIFRWAVAEEFESWLPCEPTKGWSHKIRYLFDPSRGADDFVVGTSELNANIHYTIHRHDPPEIYHVLAGAGTIYVGEEAFEVTQGSTVYVPGGVRHGVDTFDQDLRIFWVYGLDRTGPDWTWEALEDIYNEPPEEVKSRRSGARASH